MVNQEQEDVAALGRAATEPETPFWRSVPSKAPPAEEPDLVNHPPHYTSHPSGVECVQVAEHFGFNIGNAFKYLWRSDLKDDPIADLYKARWYIDREIQRRNSTR